MRKIITIVCIVLICNCAAKAQYVTLPDTNLKNQLIWWYPECFNAAGQMDTACAQIANVEFISLNNYHPYRIVNFEGLRHLKRLKHFECAYIDSNDVFPALPDSLVTLICQMSTGLQSLPALPATLRYFNCAYSNYLTFLPPLNAGLKRLDCSESVRLDAFPAQLPPSLTYFNASRCRPYNYFTQPLVLPPLPSGLDTLYCSESGLVTLPDLPNGLVYLDCSVNPITSLPALPNSIQYLNCYDFRRYAPSSIDDTSRIDLPTLPSSLTYFNCMGSGFRAMQPLPAGLETLICSGVPVSSAIIFPSTLQELACASCGIRTFPPSLNKLKTLDCGNNPLYTIPYLSDSLTSLHCAMDSLSSLPSLPAGLTFIYCYGNQLTSLPSLPNNLNQLYCLSNLLTSLPPLPANLSRLECSYNRLSSLPVLPDTLESLYCSGNQLTSLPVLPRNLRDLNCHSNQLTYLPELPPSLSNVGCQLNNIYCLPVLPQANSTLFIRADWKINCLPNTAPNVYVEVYDSGWLGSTLLLQLCNPTNNSSNCQAYPTMQGNAFFDINNNGIKDAGETFKTNARVNLSNNAYTFTNNNGLFEIAADNIGSYTLHTVAPRYYKYVPASYTFNFTTYDTFITTRDFAFQIDSIVDELTIRITPINWAARPGFSYPYMISYENTGTTVLSPSVVFDYDETRLNYSTSSVTGVTDNNNTLTLNPGSLEPGQGGNFIGYFTIKTTAVLGDSLKSTLTATADSYITTAGSVMVIGGSFDPNDKQATPQLSPLQVANGEYIDYTIRFQNTGTDTAFTVVISDTLSDDLQVNTLQMIASSHNCKTTVKDNIVFFEFLNILLPDSNINEPLSHGFVSFKIKPQTTVAVNTTIPNSAAIYFDYNAHVITNTAGTLIKDLIVLPLRLISFNAMPQNDNTTSLYWNTSNELNTRHFVIERSSDGSAFTSIASVFAQGRANNNYNSSVDDPTTGIVFYRLKIVDNNGSFTYSPVIKIDRRKNTAGIAVLTNPVKDFIIINTNDRSLVNSTGSIINMQGAVVKNFILKQGSQTVDIKDLPAGVYYLRTVNGSSRIVVN